MLLVNNSVSIFMGVKIAFIVCLGGFLAVSCNHNYPQGIDDGETCEICKLGEEMQLIGIPGAFDIVNDSLFVVSDNERVFLYNFSGEQKAQIGNPGNARFEYIRPSSVCADSDSIYVWSSATMKFISYSIDGKAGCEYEYSSAVQNFDVKGDSFWIYTAGRRGDNVLDCYSKRDRSIKGVGGTSIEHQVLSMNASASPFLVVENGVAFCTKDELSVSCYDELSGQVVNRENFNSDSFTVDALSDDALRMERAERSKYLRGNPLVLAVLPDGDGGYNILTLEGKTELAGGEICNDSRYYGLYQKKRGKPVARYISPQTFGYWHLMRVHDGELFFIQNEIANQSDVYKLCRFIK